MYEFSLFYNIKSWDLFHFLSLYNSYTEKFTKYKCPPAWIELLNSLSYHWISTVHSANSDGESNMMGMFLYF